MGVTARPGRNQNTVEDCMSEQLKPCPFCGGADIRPFDNSVVCNSCSASGPDLGHCVGAECRNDAIAAWNRRAEAQP